MEPCLRLPMFGQWVEVFIIRNVKDDDGNPCFGTADANALRIELEEEQTTEQLKETLIHELIEIANSMGDLGLEHQTISTLSNLLHQSLTELLAFPLRHSDLELWGLPEHAPGQLPQCIPDQTLEPTPLTPLCETCNQSS